MVLCGDKTDVGGGGVGAGGGCPPPEGHQTAGGEGGAGQEYLCNNKQRSIGFIGFTVLGWNSTTS